MAITLVRNGHLIDPSQKIDKICDILIKDGLIVKVEESIKDSVDTVIEAKGLTVIPGLIDMHVHLRDPGFTHKEDIYTAYRAAVTGGITSVLAMPNTKPVTDNIDTINYINATSQKARAKVYICGAITKGLQGDELTDFDMYKASGVVAVSDDGRPVESEVSMQHAMELAAKRNLLVISHCEDLEMIAGGIMHLGEVSQSLCVKGMNSASEDNITQREINLAKTNNLSVHIAHVSSKGALEAIRKGKLDGIKVTAETCPHYFAYTHDKLKSKDADYRMNPPLREQKDIDAVIEAIKDGTIDCIVTDHAPHTKKEKENFLTAPNGVIGMETSLAASIRYLVEPGHISMYKLIELMSTNPAKLLGIKAGSLAAGFPADIAIVDINAQWTVLPERLQSKSKNCVFKFERLQGRVKYTLVDGVLSHIMKY